MNKPSKQWESVIGEGFEFPPIDPSMPLADAVSTACNAVEQHVLRSEAVRSYLEKVPKGADTYCPDSPLNEIVKYVADQKSAIDKSDPELTLRFLLHYIVPVFELEQDAVFDAIEKIDDISEDEKRLFFDCAVLAEFTDRFWAKWFEKVAVPYQLLREAEQQHYCELVKDVLAQNDYTAFTYDKAKGCMERVSWARSFPGEIADILSILEVLKETPLEGLGPYFSALHTAYACEDIAKLEDRWTKVDEAWVRIPRSSRLVPVHGMEPGYEHPFGVSPEFRLEVRTGDCKDMMQKIRASTLEHAEAIGLSAELLKVLSQKLERIDISVFTGALRAGTSLNFRIAGQAVPNRQNVLQEGGRIFVDKASGPRAAKRYIENIEKHCTQDTRDVLVPLITGDAQLAATTSHEYAHPVGRTKESDEGLGAEVMKLCEEAKATLLGVLAEEYEDRGAAHRLSLVANTVGRVLRFMDKTELENSTFAPYVRENVASATTLLESGVMSLTPHGVVVDIGKAQGDAWFDALRKFNRGVLIAYKDHDRETTRALADRYCNKEHPEVAKLIAWVNR